MKLVRYGEPENEQPGVLIGDEIFGTHDLVSDYNETFLGSSAIDRLRAEVDSGIKLPKVEGSVRFGIPFTKPSKIVCVGLNYSDHAAETGAKTPEEPILFFKSTSAITGPNDKLVIPKNSVKTDWEVELAIVIGKKASYINEANAMEHIAGYCLHNDYSERAFQIERGGQWVKGKSCDTFAPMGPYLVTRDEIADVNNLKLWLKVNGQLRQNGSTANMIFKVPFLVSYISQFMTLLPGDIISTGTPAGVGLGLKPPVFIGDGDVIELGIEGLGEQKQTAVNWK